MTRTPIGILAFNRSDYLRQTLESLVAQTGDVLADREIHLFQDGGVNKISGREYATPDILDKNIEIFKCLFPEGIVHRQEENLGIARHFDYIERYFFETNEFEVAIIFEDDLILSPQYISIMERLIPEALKNEKIGYVAAYGNHRTPLVDQLKNLGKIVEMDHKWGFAVTRRQWLRQKPKVDEYLEFIAPMDYNKRNERVIVDWYLSKGILPTGTSQDSFKDAMMSQTGAVKLMTYCCYGRYIGKIGVHSNEDIYKKMGFGETQICPEVAAEFVWPTDGEIDRIIAARRRALLDNIPKIENIYRFYKAPPTPPPAGA